MEDMNRDQIWLHSTKAQGETSGSKEWQGQKFNSPVKQ